MPIVEEAKAIANAAGAARNALTKVREGIEWFKERGVEPARVIDALDADLTDAQYAEMSGETFDAAIVEEVDAGDDGGSSDDAPAAA